MINGLYMILDNVAVEFGPVFEAKNDNVAIRNFKELLIKTSDPSSFVLYSCGSVDHDLGIITGMEPEIVKYDLSKEE